MTNPPTHVAYSDESYQTEARFRSVAVVTLRVSDREIITTALTQLLQESGVREFKWEKLRQARERFAAMKLLDATLALACDGRLRVDVLVWDTHDSRHQIPGRDDIANLQRMYYHLFKNVLQRRWAPGSTWQLLPDENTALDWSTVQDYLDTAGLNDGTDGNLLEGEFYRRLERDFKVQAISQACSTNTPLCQLADLFTGLGAFSYSAYDRYESWMRTRSGQMELGICLSDTVSRFTNREQERFLIMQNFERKCKQRKLRVGVRSSRGFRTHDPQHPINFWLYQPQHSDDKAPTKATTLWS